MDKKKFIKLGIFNGIIILLNIIIFSKGILAFSPSSNNAFISAFSITFLVMTVLIFFYGNYKLLKSVYQQTAYVMDDLDQPGEFVDALQTYKRKSAISVFTEDVVEQINILIRKKKTLETVLYQRYREEAEEFQSLMQVVEDTGQLLYDNTKRILSRMEIFDQDEFDKLSRINITGETDFAKMQIFNEHLSYIKEYKLKNDAILLQFDNLLIEVSKLGDKEDTRGLEKFQATVRAMKNLRADDSELSELERKYKNEG